MNRLGELLNRLGKFVKSIRKIVDRLSRHALLTDNRLMIRASRTGIIVGYEITD